MNLVKQIPNAITSMNLLCGAVGVILAFEGRPDAAFVAMIAGMVFDFCDGLAARALGAYSVIGKELDSLADVVTFGVLPALLLHTTMKACGILSFWCYVPLVIAVFSALRLAKFNVDERQHDSFIGLATPSSAMICGSLCHFMAVNPSSGLSAFCTVPYVLPVLSIVLSMLLVSEIPMISFKFGKGTEADGKTKVMRITMLALVLLCIIAAAVFGLKWSLAVLAVFVAYVVLNLVALAIR